MSRDQTGHEHHHGDHHRQQEVLVRVSRGDRREQERGRPDADELESIVLRVTEAPGRDQHGDHEADAEEVGGELSTERVADVIGIRRHQREPHVVHAGADHEGNDHSRHDHREGAAHDQHRPPVPSHQAPEHDRAEVGKRRLLDQEPAREEHADRHQRERTRSAQGCAGAGAEEPNHPDRDRADQQALRKRQVPIQHRRADDHRNREPGPQCGACGAQPRYTNDGGADGREPAQDRQRMETCLAGAEEPLT